LEDPNLVVEALDHSQADLVVGVAIRSDAMPVLVDELGEFLVGLEALPLKANADQLGASDRRHSGIGDEKAIS
jgi:hypothetical protein